MTWRQTFAKMIGVPEHQAEDALHSERAARATLTRRNLFAGGAALAAGSVFSFPTPAPIVLPWNVLLPLFLPGGLFYMAQKGTLPGLR